MAQEILPSVIPVEASDATCVEPLGPKAPKKGFCWSENENIALARAASVVCTDSTVGSSMTATTMFKNIRALFVNDPVKHHDACTTRDKSESDARRWDGRSYGACGKQWEVIRRECTKFKGCVDRIDKMKLTGNISEDDLYRCASLLYSDGEKSASHVYDCVRNPAYHIAKPFKFHNTYVFLAEKTTLLEAGGVENGQLHKRERPVGTKTAKKQELEKKGQTEEVSMTESIRRIEEIMAKNAAHRHDLYQQKLSFQREKMEWEMAQTLLGPGFSASVQEREEIGTLLRKCLIDSLSQTERMNGVVQTYKPKNESESNGVSALLKMSNISMASCAQDSSSDVNAIDKETL